MTFSKNVNYKHLADTGVSITSGYINHTLNIATLAYKNLKMNVH